VGVLPLLHGPELRRYRPDHLVPVLLVSRVS